MAACGFCRQRFKSAQSVRAHLRFCIAYQARPSDPYAGRDAVPKAALPSIGTLSASERCAVTNTQRGRLLALNIEEKLRALVKLCREHGEYAHLMEQLTGSPGGPGIPQWADLYGNLLQAHRDADLLVNGLTDDRSLPLDLYRRIVVVKERWLDYRCQQLTPQGLGEVVVNDQIWQAVLQEDRRRYGVLHEEVTFDSLLGELKQLIAITPSKSVLERTSSYIMVYMDSRNHS